MSRTLPLLFVLSIVFALGAARAVADDCREMITNQKPSGELAGWKAFSEDPDTRTGDVWKLAADGVLVCTGTPKGYIYTEICLTAEGNEIHFRNVRLTPIDDSDK